MLDTTLSLAFPTERLPTQTRVVAAMSGGVDSSVVAAALARQGYDVVGVTLQLYDHGAAQARPGACCAGRDVADARRVAETAGFPHYVLDYEDRFRKAVIDDFADQYLAGATPIPCVRCNQRVKFRDLLETARELEADCLATGHYARRKEGPLGPELHRAVDASRDQSYFLFATTRAQLAFLRFPLGEVASKADVRAMAATLGLDLADKRDSQDICFVPQGGYADVIARLRPGAARPGDIVDEAGRVLGAHQGVIRYTVGQRRGLGLSSADGAPLYVIRIEAESARVVVGPRERLETTRVRVTDVNWLGDAPFAEAPAAGWEVEAKVRSTRPASPARVRPTDPACADVELAVPERGVAPGQACVFYDGDRVLGGGWIASR